MIRKRINPFEYAAHILESLKSGILLTTRSSQKTNVMTIAWGMLGIEWGLPVFITFVRAHRYSRLCLEENPEFTVNAPLGSFDKRILGVAGTRSGRDMDKIASLGLHPVPGAKVGVPAIAEFPLTLECRVIYAQLQDKDAVRPDLRAAYHPQGKDPFTSVLNGDYHTAYYGEIVDAYILG